MQLLLEHLATAREAASSARLDELEREADTVLGQALEAGSLRHLDTHRVTALGLAIDQVRLAIRDRRRQIEAGDASAVKTFASSSGASDKAAFKSAVADFYMTNPIARASRIMAECSALKNVQKLEAAE